MRKVIDISEIIETLKSDRGSADVCATAEGEFDEAKSELTVTLDAKVHSANFKPGDSPYCSGLPKRQVVKERVPLEEAIPAAKEIFSRWVSRIRKSLLVLEQRT